MTDSASAPPASAARTVSLPVCLRAVFRVVRWLNQSTVCGALSDGDERFPRPKGELCECKDGWGGINCNRTSAHDPLACVARQHTRSLQGRPRMRRIPPSLRRRQRNQRRRRRERNGLLQGRFGRRAKLSDVRRYKYSPFLSSFLLVY